MNTKKIALIVSTLIFSSSLLSYEAAHASSFSKILNQMNKATRNGGVVTQSSTSLSPYISTENMSVDGTYYVGGGYATKQNKGIVKRYSLNITSPSLLKLYFINDSTNVYLDHSLYDSNDNSINGKLSVGKGKADVFTYIVRPGIYRLDLCGLIGLNYSLAYKAKAIAEPLNTNSSPDCNRSEKAIPVNINSNIKGYFPHKRNNVLEVHYYVLDLDSPRNISLIFRRNETTGPSCSIELVDRDELLVGYKGNLSYNETRKMDYSLNPGRYYIKIKCDDYSGTVYNFTIR